MTLSVPKYVFCFIFTWGVNCYSSWRRYANGVHLSAIWENTALVQWIRCEPLGEHLRLIHCTSAVYEWRKEGMNKWCIFACGRNNEQRFQEIYRYKVSNYAYCDGVPANKIHWLILSTVCDAGPTPNQHWFSVPCWWEETIFQWISAFSLLKATVVVFHFINRSNHFYWEWYKCLNFKICNRYK